MSRTINFFFEKTSEEIDACVETGLKEDCHHLPSHRPQEGDIKIKQS